LKKIAAVFWLFMKTRIKGNIQYRGAFWIDSITFILGYGTQAALMFLMVSRFDTINGWKPFEVMTLYGYILASYTLSNSFLSGIMHDLSDSIRKGNFDQSLTKPMHPLVYEMANSFSDYYFLHFFLALGMIFFCAANLSIVFTAGKILVLAVSVLGGAFIQGGIQIFFSAASFFVFNNPLNGNLYNHIRPMAEYPTSVFPKWIQFVYSTVVPLSFAAFYPAQNLLGKEDFLFFPRYIQYLSLPVGLAFFILAFQFWSYALRFYKSSGS
jgi:ABC-2 type transport system permease protein